MNPGGEIAGSGLIPRQGFSQDLPCLFFHGPAPVSGPDPEQGLGFFIETANGDALHGWITF